MAEILAPSSWTGLFGSHGHKLKVTPPPLQEEPPPPMTALPEQPDGIQRPPGMPGEAEVQSIILKMRKCDIKSMLPPDLRYTETPEDTIMAQNIRLLFSDRVMDNGLLEESLCAIVARSNNLMTETQKMQVLRKNQHVLHGHELLAFYPHLVGVIKVLLIHCQEYHDSLEDKAKSTNNFVLAMWQEVLGFLRGIHSVIVYASRLEILNLENFPISWKDILDEMQTQTSKLKAAIHESEKEILRLQTAICERNEKIQAINSEYAQANTDVALAIAEKQNVQNALEYCIDVGKHCQTNILSLQNAFPSESRIAGG